MMFCRRSSSFLFSKLKSKLKMSFPDLTFSDLVASSSSYKIPLSPILHSIPKSDPFVIPYVTKSGWPCRATIMLPQKMWITRKHVMQICHHNKFTRCTQIHYESVRLAFGKNQFPIRNHNKVCKHICYASD